MPCASGCARPPAPAASTVPSRGSPAAGGTTAPSRRARAAGAPRRLLGAGARGQQRGVAPAHVEDLLDALAGVVGVGPRRGRPCRRSRPARGRPSSRGPPPPRAPSSPPGRRARAAPAARPRAGTRAWPRGGRRAPSCPPTSTRPGSWAARARARGAGAGTRARRGRTATPRPAPPHRPSEVAGGPGAHASPRPGTGPSGGVGQSPAGAGPNPPPLGSRRTCRAPGPGRRASRGRPRAPGRPSPWPPPQFLLNQNTPTRREAAILAQVLSPLPEWPASMPCPRCGKDIPATSCRTGIRRSTRWDALPATSLIFGVSFGVVRNLAVNYGLLLVGCSCRRYANA